jgi:hypothetical protein
MTNVYPNNKNKNKKNNKVKCKPLELCSQVKTIYYNIKNIQSEDDLRLFYHVSNKDSWVDGDKMILADIVVVYKIMWDVRSAVRVALVVFVGPFTGGSQFLGQC